MRENLTRNLVKAIENRNLGKAKRLVFFGANVNGLNDDSIEPPVFAAARTGNVEILSFLKNKGANLDVFFKGIPALFAGLEADLKQKENTFAITKFYIESGADFIPCESSKYSKRQQKGTSRVSYKRDCFE